MLSTKTPCKSLFLYWYRGKAASGFEGILLESPVKAWFTGHNDINTEIILKMGVNAKQKKKHTHKYASSC